MAATLKKTRKRGLPTCVLRAGNISFDKLNMLWNIKATSMLIGPTAPTQLSLPKGAKIGWVTTISGVSELDYPILSPEDPSMVSVFLNKTLKTVPEDRRPVILGDFLDNMIPHMDEDFSTSTTLI